MPPATQQDADGEAKPMVPDLEGQGTGAAGYGAVEPLKGDKANAPEGEAGRLYQAIVATYVALFAIYFLCDFLYLLTVDGRFPRSMGADGIKYPSEEERQATVSYTRYMTILSMLGSATKFVAVAAMVYFHLFWKVDVELHKAINRMDEKRLSYYEWFAATWIGGIVCTICYYLWMPVGWLLGALSRCCCCCGPCQRSLENHDWRRLLHGSVYCGLLATFFLVLTIPFSYAALTLELEYGFANALMITKGAFVAGISGQIMNTLIWSIPSTFLFLAVLQFRFGWLFMWIGMTLLMTFVQFNMAALAPVLMGMNNIFPNEAFAVGRGFPLAATDSKYVPWISLNRIFFRDPGQKVQFSTHDLSQGMLSLELNRTSGSWVIADKYHLHGTGAKVYAQVLAPTGVSRDGALNVLNETPWPDLHHTGYVGIRLGDKLRNKLTGFAKEHNINIQEIYLIDGSHKDARANAFAGGAGDSIIGLYDTLFLGEHEKDSATSRKEALAVQQLESGESAIQFFSSEVQGLDVEEDVETGAWSSAPTQAMSDDEIVAILGHELAHAAMGHLYETTWRQAATTFVTFAAMGWAAHSPLLASAFMLPGPVLHIGYSIYQFVIGPPLNKVVKFISDARIRYNEYEADAFVAEMSPRYGTALQTGLAKLSVNTNQDPDAPWWYEALHHDHPTVSHRFQNIEKVMAETHAQPHAQGLGN